MGCDVFCNYCLGRHKLTYDALSGEARWSRIGCPKKYGPVPSLSNTVYALIMCGLILLIAVGFLLGWLWGRYA